MHIFLLIPSACSKYKNIEPIPNEAIIEGEFNRRDGKMHFILWMILFMLNPLEICKILKTDLAKG